MENFILSFQLLSKNHIKISNLTTSSKLPKTTKTQIGFKKPLGINTPATHLGMVCISLLQSSTMTEEKVSSVKNHNSIISFGNVSY